MRIKNPCGSRFMLSFIDDFSTYVNVYFLRNKNEVTTEFIEYKLRWSYSVELRSSVYARIKGSEFQNQKFDAFCWMNGIIHRKQCLTARNKRESEMNRTVTEHDALQVCFADLVVEAVNTAVHRSNRTTTSTNKTMTIFEMCLRRNQTYFFCAYLDHLDMHMSAKQNVRNSM